MGLIARKLATVGAVAFALFGAFVGSVHAQAFPSKPIRIVVPFPAGGGTDLIARDITQKVAASTGWTFVIENKPGAGGNLGVDAVAKAPADGYTLVLGQTSNLSINPALYAKIPYDVQRDLAPIVMVAKSPLIVVTSANSPFKTMADVVTAAKAKPGTVNFASSGNGTVAHLSGELLQRAAGIKMQHVPYKGANQGLTDVMAGSVELYVSSVPTMLAHVKQGKLRALAVTSASRVPDLPTVPTMIDSGYVGLEATTWFGFLAPAATPKDVLAIFNTEFNKALQQRDLRKKMADSGADPVGGTAEQFAAFIKAENQRWAQVIKDSGTKVE